MKEQYINPEMEIVEFESEDVICASGDALPEVNFSLLVNGDTLADFDQNLIPDDEEP